MSRLESNNRISSVQPKIKNYYDKEKFDYAGGCGGEIDIFGFPFARGRIIDVSRRGAQLLGFEKNGPKTESALLSLYTFMVSRYHRMLKMLFLSILCNSNIF